MTDKKNVRCYRCGKRLKKGGDNFRLECTITADFDGHIDTSVDRKGLEDVIEEIELSGLTEKELEEQVYFYLKRRMCLDCRNEIVNFLKGFDQNE